MLTDTFNGKLVTHPLLSCKKNHSGYTLHLWIS